MNYESTKTYGNERGLSCCFRQWQADSHSSYLHGYSWGFRFTFETNELDKRNWVYDFGGCKWIKVFLEQTFDHKLVVDNNDPEKDRLVHLSNIAITGPPVVVADVLTMDGVGCEKFAEYVYNYVAPKVLEETNGRVNLRSVECFEHGSNSAIYYDDFISLPGVIK